MTKNMKLKWGKQDEEMQKDDQGIFIMPYKYM